MKKRNTNFKQGFTIIEVVLVLAIAGLIMLMVFVALPSLQRNQRDTERKNNYNIIASAITSYMSDHHGGMPSNFGDLSNYVSGIPNTSVDKYDNTTVSVNASTDGGTVNDVNASATNPVIVMTGIDCDNNHATRNFALIGYLESGGKICIDNN